MSSRPPTVVIVGRPNVGKSTLFNRVIQRRVAVVQDMPGVTRDRLYSSAEWRGKKFQIVDTGGIVFGDDDPLIDQIQVQTAIGLQEADVVLMMVDAKVGLQPGDFDLAQRLRGFPKPVFLIANKADATSHDAMAAEFYELGIGEVRPVSSIHGRGVADLLDEIVELLPDDDAAPAEDELRVAIVGRPNVGKSSLVNAFVGEQRMIVSDIPGTTRDAVDTQLIYKNVRFRLVDTAGIRRKGRIQGSVEYYMVDRAQKALERCDCALVVIDGAEGLTDGDKRIMKLAHDAGRACVVAVNKWDVVEPPDGRPRTKSAIKKDFLRIFGEEVPEIGYAIVSFTSAQQSAGLEPVLDSVLEAQKAYEFRISTGAVNRLIQEAVDDHPYNSKGKAFKIYYATQAAIRPPAFVLFCNDPSLMHFSYQRYLMNRIRKEYPLKGTAIRVFARSSHDRS